MEIVGQGEGVGWRVSAGEVERTTGLGKTVGAFVRTGVDGATAIVTGESVGAPDEVIPREEEAGVSRVSGMASREQPTNETITNPTVIETVAIFTPVFFTVRGKAVFPWLTLRAIFLPAFIYGVILARSSGVIL